MYAVAGFSVAPELAAGTDCSPGIDGVTATRTHKIAPEADVPADCARPDGGEEAPGGLCPEFDSRDDVDPQARFAAGWV